MSTVYDYDLHDLGQSAFQSIQERALFEQSLRDATPTSVSSTPPAPPAATTSVADRPRGGLLRKLMVGAAVVGAVGGVLYVGRRMLSTGKD